MRDVVPTNCGRWTTKWHKGASNSYNKAVPIAGLAAGSAVAREAGEVAASSAVAEAGKVPAGSAVAREAEQAVFWLKDAPVPEEDDGCGPALPPQGSAKPLLPGALPLEHPTAASPPRPKKQRILFAVAVPIERSQQ